MPCRANSSAANACVLLHVQRRGDSGSPRVIGSTSFSSAGHTSGCATSYGRLPALRRTFTTSSRVAPARASSRPLRTVLIAMPVARATAATPPQPIAPASVPAHSRRARSSIVAFNRRHFWRTTFSAPAPTSTVDHASGILSIPCKLFRRRFDLLGYPQALRSVERLKLNVDVGEGLTRASLGLAFKAIIGWEFETLHRCSPLPIA